MEKIKVLVKPEKEILKNEVEGYCESNFNDGSVSCGTGWSCSPNYNNNGAQTCLLDDEDILF